MYIIAYSGSICYQVLSDPAYCEGEVWYIRPEKEECPVADYVRDCSLYALLKI